MIRNHIPNWTILDTFTPTKFFRLTSIENVVFAPNKKKSEPKLNANILRKSFELICACNPEIFFRTVWLPLITLTFLEHFSLQDRFYLSAVERKWHATCLQCCICRQTLEGANSCFSRDGNIYCKTDYYR